MGVEIPHWSKGSVILMGLVHKTTPVEARAAYRYNLIDVYPDEKIKDQLETIAVILHRHINNSIFLKSHCGKVPSGKSTLGYLLSSVYLEHVPTGSTSASETPKLKQVARLPLAQWDSLYYALQADVRQLYAALDTKIGIDVAAGDKIVHFAGPGGASSNHPYSVLDLATQLEEMWFLLNDQHLIARLDQALRVKMIKSNTRVRFASDEDPVLLTLAAALKSEAGLSNTHSLSAYNIALMLYKMIDAQFHAEVKKDEAAVDRQKLIAAARGEARRVAVAARKRRLKAAQIDILCSCQQSCHCQAELDCGLQQGECPCAFARHEISGLVKDQQEVHDTVQKDAEDAGLLILPATTFMKANDNEEARMQVAALATADPYIVQMCKLNAEEAAKRDEHSLGQHRSRAHTGTNDIDLAYVPRPKGRTPKDPYPLAFYSDSPQRYPRVKTGRVADAARAFDAAHMPPPTPTHPPSFKPRALTYGENRVPVLPADSASTPVQAAYSATPVAQDGRLFRHWSPPAVTPSSQHDLDINVSASEYVALTDMARGHFNPFRETIYDPFVQSTTPQMGSRAPGPASDEDLNHVQYALKPHVRTQTLSDSKPSVRSPIQHQKVRSDPTVSQPHHPLPDPAYHLPAKSHTPSPPHDRPLPPLPPHPKQRWVSAGGTAKLSERPEIAAPDVFMNAYPRGCTVNAAAFLSQLGDPDVVEATRQYNRASTEKRSSAERRSNERERRHPATPLPRSSPSRNAGEKHGRQDSTGSSGRERFAKLKRVFSRSGNSP